MLSFASDHSGSSQHPDSSTRSLHMDASIRHCVFSPRSTCSMAVSLESLHVWIHDFQTTGKLHALHFSPTVHMVLASRMETSRASSIVAIKQKMVESEKQRPGVPAQYLLSPVALGDPPLGT